jgi:hypothetical protein
MIKDKKILTEITESCEQCPKREKCLEEDCVLFRIEQILVEKCKT